MTTTVSSRHNPVFKRIREAIHEHDREIVIEGPKMVEDAIAAGWKPILTIRSGVEFTAELFEAVSDTKASQGILALFERPAPADVFARKDSIVVALDGVQDPGNVGTIIRLAAAFDASGVALLPGCADPFSPKAIRASAGAVLNVPIAQIERLEHPNMFAADGTGQTIDPPARDGVIVLGSEGAGVSDAIRVQAKRIAIPMSGRVESLNVAAAAAILLSRSFSLRRS